MADDIAELKGDSLELRYQRHAPAYFGPIIRRIHVLGDDERWKLLDPAIQRGQLSQDQADEVVLADLLIRGRRRDDDSEVYLVVDVSWGVGSLDVERAAERAALLARAGVRAIPVVAGNWVGHDAQQQARLAQVWQVTDGRAVPPEPS